MESLVSNTQEKLLQIATEPGNKTPWHLPMLRMSRKSVALVQTIYDPDKCVLCNRCVDVCPEYFLQLPPVD